MLKFCIRKQHHTTWDTTERNIKFHFFLKIFKKLNTSSLSLLAAATDEVISSYRPMKTLR